MPDVARTLDLPPDQRFDYWKHVLSDTFVPLEVSSPGGEADFRGRLRGCELGSLRLIEVQAEPHTARRTARLVKAAPAGCYKIGVQLRGTSLLIQDGREALLTPGDFAVYDTDRPYSLALYLLFGPAIFSTLAERAAIHFEYVVERQPELCPGCARE